MLFKIILVWFSNYFDMSLHKEMPVLTKPDMWRSYVHGRDISAPNFASLFGNYDEKEAFGSLFFYLRHHCR